MKTWEQHSFWAFFYQSLLKVDALIPHLAKVNPAKIHAFRLEIKRLNTLLDVLCYRNSWELEVAEAKNLVRVLYKAAGEVRQYSIFRKLVIQTKIPHITRFNDYLNTRMEIAKRELRHYSNEFIYSNFYPLCEVICDILHPFSEESLPICYVQKMQSELDVILHSDLRLANYHQLHVYRKSLKTVLFLQEVNDCFYQIMNIDPSFSYALKMKEKYIGQWHDWNQLYKEILVFLQVNPELMTNVNMIRLRYKVKAECDKLYQIITDSSQHNYNLSSFKILTN